MTTAEFTISADPYSNLGYDADLEEVLSLQLAASPALDVNQTKFEQVTKSDGAPDLVFSPVSGIAATPTGTVTTTMPSSGMHSWSIRCEITTANPDVEDDTKERIVAIRQAGLRKMVPAERTEYDGTYGWTEMVNALAVAMTLLGAGAWREPVRVATAAALPANTRTDNTLDADANGALPSQDGTAMAVGDRLLVWKEAASHLKHGIYEIDDLGSAGTKWAMTRVATFDESTEVTKALTVAVEEGDVYGGQRFRLRTTGTITINTTALEFEVQPELTENLVFDHTVSSPTVQVETTTAAGMTGSPLILKGQDATDVTSTGGKTIAKAPAGGSANGEVELWDAGGTARLTLDDTNLTAARPFTLQSFTVAGVPAAASYTGAMIYVTDESGGAVPAFSDGTNWRRVTDRAVIS